MILANHYKNGLCDMDCYFCDLKKPIKILGTERERLKNLIDLSNDIRYMEYQK